MHDESSRLSRYLLLFLLTTASALTACSDAGQRSDEVEPKEVEEEVCNGEDDDGDGEVDEDFAVGEECTIGDGACADVSTTVCAPDGASVVCDAEAATPAVELCGDQIDNDCDGEVDEGFDEIGEACSVGVGACEVAGQLSCLSDGTVGCDAEAIDPPEANEITCDAIDNDCDGDIDEGCDDDGDGWCEAGFVSTETGPCPDGDGDCDDEDSDVFPGSTVSGCDGKDNDCDGDVDEYQPIPGSSVTASIPLRNAVYDYSGVAPGLLIAPMDNGSWCGIGTTYDNAIASYFIFNPTTASAPPLASDPTREPYLMDIVPDGDTCMALVGYLDAGANTERLRMVEIKDGTHTALKRDVSTDHFAMRPWTAAAFAVSPGMFHIAAWVVGESQARVFRRRYTTSNNELLMPSLVNDFTAIGPDVTAGRDGIIATTILGSDQFYNYNSKDEFTVPDWNGEFEHEFTDVAAIGDANYVSGHDGSKFWVRLLGYNGDPNAGGTPTLAASGSVASSEDREFMTRIQLFEGPGGAVFAIDAAADEVYELVINGAEISFVPADVSWLPAGANLIGGRGVDDATIEVVTHMQPETGGGELTATQMTCF